MKNKSFKGMTLVEVIIAMAVLAIASSVMCTAIAGVCKVKVSTNALNKRINYQAPIADNRLTGTNIAEKTSSTVLYTDGVEEYTDAAVVSANGIKVKVYGNTYQVSDTLTYDDGTGSEYTQSYGAGGVVDVSTHNFKFFKTDTTKYTASGTGSGLVVKLP